MNRDYDRRLVLGFSLALCALVFLVNLILPLGFAIWLAYLVIVALVAWVAEWRVAAFLAAVSTLLIVVGFFIAPEGIAPEYAAVNRAIGILLVWSAAYLVSNRRLLLDRVEAQAAELSAANLQLQRQAAELHSQAEELQMQAEELQVQAEELQVQAEELQVQAEELQAQNHELRRWTDTLEQRVRDRTAALRKAHDSLKEMSVRLLAVQENERRAIARELHDESGQVLTAMIIQLRLLREKLNRGDPPTPVLDELSQMTQQLGEGLHRLAVNLRPTSLDRAGLIAAVEQYVDFYRKTYGVQTDFLASGFNGDRLAPELESALYRIVQEALTNVARHAQASQASVALYRRPDAVAAIIEDNGVGLNVEAAQRADRLGLMGMRERAELLGGSLSIESRPGVRTTVFVEIPCRAHASGVPPG